jgi:putative proteasome-type protease
MFEQFHIDFNVCLLVGGQIREEACRLFQIYSAGNFIESVNESTCFQIGESKYGKPILDRVITRHSSLDEAAKCALISMDSTLRSNVSVGLPLDLLVYEADRLAVTRFVRIDEKNRYFRMIRETWGQKLKRVFQEIEDPVWHVAPVPDVDGDVGESQKAEPPRIAPPDELAALGTGEQPPHQTLVQPDARQPRQ